jgi:hypothetical protein
VREYRPHERLEGILRAGLEGSSCRGPYTGLERQDLRDRSPTRLEETPGVHDRDARLKVVAPK